MLGSYVALWVLVVVLAVALLALYSHFGQVYLSSREGRENQGPKLGDKLPALRERTLHGDQVQLPAGRPALILVASTDCPECEKLKQPLQQLAATADVDVAVLCAGQRSQVTAWARGLQPPVQVIVDKNFARASAMGVGVTPFMVGIGPDGVVRAKGLVNRDEGLHLFLEAVLDVESDRAPLRPVAIAAGAAR
jgi:Redoxin